MTGIAGFVRKTPTNSDSLLKNMTHSMTYSKDASVDTWNNELAGFCRVHLGAVNQTPQPLFNEDKTTLLMLDGEVFDYQNDHLPKNDASYCLSMYEKHRDQSFARLNGSFSIAIYNTADNELLLVTDRFSSRPLFYSSSDDSAALYFGSRLATVLQPASVQRELELGALFELITFQRVFGTKTLCRNVEMIPPGMVLKYKAGHLSFDQYWKLTYREVERPERYYEENLTNALARSVERRTRDQDLRYGLLLSGGIDSRTVLAATNKQVVTFTVADAPNREVGLAREISRTKGVRHVFIPRALDHYVRTLDQAVELSDGLYAFDHAHFIGLLDGVKEDFDVLLHGCFLDMLKGAQFPIRPLKFVGKDLKVRGETIRTTFLIDSFLAKISDEQFVDLILDDAILGPNAITSNPLQIFRPTYSAKAVAHIRETIKNLLDEAKEKTANPSYWWDYVISWHMLPKVPSFLHFSHIREFIPERCIFFDNDLFDTFLEMPLKLKRSGKVYQKALKKLNPKMAIIPNSNTKFSPQTPKLLESFLVRGILPKLKHIFISPAKSIRSEGSWPDFAELLRQNEELRAIFEQTVNDPDLIDPAIFDREAIMRIFRDHVSRRADYHKILFLILTFGRWQRKFHARIDAK